MKTQLSLKKQIKLSAQNKCAVSTAHETSKEISISTRTFQFGSLSTSSFSESTWKIYAYILDQKREQELNQESTRAGSWRYDQTSAVT